MTDTLPENDLLLTMEQLAKMLSVSVQKIYAWRANGKGPKALKLSHRVVRYRLSDVKIWLASRESNHTEVKGDD